MVGVEECALWELEAALGQASDLTVSCQVAETRVQPFQAAAFLSFFSYDVPTQVAVPPKVIFFCAELSRRHRLE